MLANQVEVKLFEETYYYHQKFCFYKASAATGLLYHFIVFYSR